MVIRFDVYFRNSCPMALDLCTYDHLVIGRLRSSYPMVLTYARVVQLVMGSGKYVDLR